MLALALILILIGAVVAAMVERTIGLLLACAGFIVLIVALVGDTHLRGT